MSTRDRGVAAATICLTAIALMGVQLLAGVALYLPDGYWMLLIAPAAGVGLGVGGFLALRRVCTRGSAGAEAAAVGIVVLLFLGSFLGISFGGLVLLPAALLLIVAHALTPRPAR